MTYGSKSEKDTFELGFKMGKEAKAGQVITLNGDLGAGKTVFTKGFAKGLGIEDIVDSPTFTLLKIYEGGRIPLYHFDVYRIGDSSEMDEIGFDEYVYGDGVAIIEWADIIKDILPEKRKDIYIYREDTIGADYRRIVINEDNCA